MHHIAIYAQKRGMGPVSSKNPDWKRVFWEGRSFAPGHFCPQSRHLVRLAHNIGEVRFITKIQAENMFFGKTNARGLLRQNWEKFLAGTILPPNALDSQLGREKRYGAVFIKKFQPKTCFLGWTKLHFGTLLPPIAPCSPFGHENRWGAIYYKIPNENVFFGKTNSRGLLRQNWAMFSSRKILPPNAPYSELGLKKRYGAGFIKKFQPKTCFLRWTKLCSGTLLPPIAPGSPLGQENRRGAI